MAAGFFFPAESGRSFTGGFQNPDGLSYDFTSGQFSDSPDQPTAPVGYDATTGLYALTVALTPPDQWPDGHGYSALVWDETGVEAFGGSFSMASGEQVGLPSGGIVVAPTDGGGGGGGTTPTPPPPARPGQISFLDPSYAVSRPGTVTIRLTRSGGLDGPVYVDYRVEDSGGLAPVVDFPPVSGTVEFRDGESLSSFTVSLNPGSSFGTILLQILNPQGGATLGTSTAVVEVTGIAARVNPGRTITGCYTPAAVFTPYWPWATYVPQTLAEAIERRLIAYPAWVNLVGTRLFQGLGPQEETKVYPYVSYYPSREGDSHYGFEDGDESGLKFITFSIFGSDTDQTERVADLLEDCLNPGRLENARNWPLLAWAKGRAITAYRVGGPTIIENDRTSLQAFVPMKANEWCFDVHGRA